MNKIVVLGSLNMDLVVRTERIPAPGETLAGQQFETISGGKGANQAAAIARLGGDVAMIGRVGDDSFGGVLTANLAAYGVRVDAVQTTPDTPSGTATIIVEASGENRIIIVAGANGKVNPRDVDAHESLIAKARALVLQFELPLETVARAMKIAHARNVPVILNPAPAYRVADDFLRKAAYLIVNESEAQLLSGKPVGDLEAIQAAAKILCAKGVDVVIVTLGSQGALLVTAASAVHVPGYAVEVVDTTAAGDSFVGGFTVSLVKGHLLENAVRYANACGALAVTKFGAQPSLPTADEVAKFLKS